MPTLEARGVELAWRARGEGAPVVLVHETAVTAGVWEPVEEVLADRARAIAYDRRGWGESTAPEGYRRTTVPEQSEDAAVLIESLKAAPAVVCGAGAGAVIALDLLLRRPGLVAGAVLIEPPLLQLLPAATEALSKDRHRLIELAAEGDGSRVVDLYLSGELPALGAGVTRLPDQIAAAGRERPRSLIAELGMPASWAMPLPRFGAAERPSVIVTATSTPPLIREASTALAGRLASSTPRELDAGDRPPHLGAPAGVATAVLELTR